MNAMHLLTEAADRNASDLLIATGQPPHLRVNGAMVRISDTPMTASDVEAFSNVITPSNQVGSTDFARDISGFPKRLRVNISSDHHGPTLTVRLINRQVPTPQDLGIPAEMVDRVTQSHSGLVVITGPTDAGKSTSIASVVRASLRDRPMHVITIEDPVEYLIEPGRGMVNQREIDKREFPQAVHDSMRQVPDIIIIGELRTPQAVQAAITAAESGHLVITSVHGRSTRDALLRISGMIGSDIANQQLSAVLVACMYQRLVPHASEPRRVLLTETLLATTSVRRLIAESKFMQLDNEINTNANMTTLTQSVQLLERRRQISSKLAETLRAELTEQR